MSVVITVPGFKFILEMTCTFLTKFPPSSVTLDLDSNSLEVNTLDGMRLLSNVCVFNLSIVTISPDFISVDTT